MNAANELSAGSVLNARELRNAFGAYPTGVTVVTCTRSDGAKIGVTANSFVSLSLAPPLVSFAIHNAARHLPVLLESGSFAINVLRRDQRELSNLFTRPSECSWDDVACRVMPSGHVVLDGAVASFLCRLAADHPVGDHRLLVGHIEQFNHDALAEPIAFCRGHYGAFRPAPHAPPPEMQDFWPGAIPSIGWG